MTQADANKARGLPANSDEGTSISRILLGTFFGLALLYSLVKLTLLGLAAIHSQYVMDEYWQGGFSIFIPDGFYQGIDPIKNVLYVYFYQLARLLSDNAVSLMLFARAESFILALGMVALTAATARNLDRTKAEMLLTVVVLLGFSTFMERAFRVRGDTLAAFFACAALWTATRLRHQIAGPLAMGCLVGLAFLATQKSVYVAVAFGVAYIVAGIIERDLPGMVRRVVLYCAGWVAMVLLYAVLFGGLEFYRVLEMMFGSPLSVAFESDDYYSNIRHYVLQTIERNQVAYALCFVGLVLVLSKLGKYSAAVQMAAVATVTLSLFIFTHNQPWPYVFVVVLPFLCHWSVETIRRIPRAGETTRMVVMLLVVVILSATLLRNLGILTHSNEVQNQVAQDAESLLGSDDRYCDGLGMVTTRRLACTIWWDAANFAAIKQLAAKGDLSLIEVIFEQEPKVWILNYRVRALLPLLESYLYRSYVRVLPNILLTGAELRAGEEITFVNRWPGRYALFTRSGEKLIATLAINDEEVRGEFPLGVGTYKLALASNSKTPGAVLLPANSEIIRELPITEQPWDLFGNVYD